MKSESWNGHETIRMESPSVSLGAVDTDSSRTPSLSREAILACVSSLLLGGYLRKWLTEGEKQFLDRLGDKDSTLFLLLGGRSLYPGESKPLSRDVIQSIVSQSDGAVFSQRHQRYIAGRLESGRIHTVEIDTVAGEPVVLGMYSALERFDREESYMRFYNLVELFRQANGSASQMYDDLQGRLSDAAITVVNRASGSIVYTSQSMQSLLGKPLVELIGTEYSRLADSISRLYARHTVSIENVASGDLHLSLISFTPLDRKSDRERTSRSVRGDKSVASEFIATIITAASFVKANAHMISLKETKEMAGIICAAAAQLENEFTYRELMAEFKRARHRCVDLIFEMEKAISHVTAGSLQSDCFFLDADSCQPFAVAPPGCYAFLFEAELDIHKSILEPGSRSLVRILQPSPDREISISIETPVSKDRLSETEGSLRIGEYDQLVTRMNMLVHRFYNMATSTLVSELTIPHQEIVKV